MYSMTIVKNWLDHHFGASQPELQRLHPLGGVLTGGTTVRTGTGFASFWGSSSPRSRSRLGYLVPILVVQLPANDRIQTVCCWFLPVSCSLALHVLGILLSYEGHLRLDPP
jgi:hypothetical protein